MMTTISKAAVQRARRFVEANARPLDRAYLDYLLPTGADGPGLARDRLPACDA